jgi:hypothetical protein
VSISPEYHRRQAATLTQLAQSTRDPETAKVLLQVAADHIARADEAVRDLSSVDKPPTNGRQPRQIASVAGICISYIDPVLDQINI